MSGSEDENRFWNAFGSTSPRDIQTLQIVCEINFPYHGIQRGIGGAFLTDEVTGEVWVGHRGLIGGGRKGIGKTRFLENYQRTSLVKDGDTQSEVAVISALRNKELPKYLAEFVKRVEWIKEPSHAKQTLPKPRGFMSEFSGEKKYAVAAPITAIVHHGLIVEKLANQIKSLGFKVGNDTLRDLFILNGKRRVIEVFEVKPDYSRTYVYSAIGQLKYNALDYPKARQVVVLPKGTPKRILSSLGKIGIENVTFTLKNDSVRFHKLADVLGHLSTQ
jgi:hypothetical protein